MNRVKRFNRQAQRKANQAGKQINKAINRAANQVAAAVQPVVGNGKPHPNNNQPLPTVMSGKPTTFQ